ncbi:MAG: hypothetical protein NTZ39_02355 [Methanoregula sp.]|nr:hypothetical protein [Methanoregula sp.]
METARVKRFVSCEPKQRGAGFEKFLQAGQIFYKNRIARWRVPQQDEIFVTDFSGSERRQIKKTNLRTPDMPSGCAGGA